jgi:hypothetical protein
MRCLRPASPRLASAAAAVLLALAPLGAQAEEAPTLRSALASVIDPNPTRNTQRLPSVDIDPNGDATVIFAIQNADDDADAIRAGALADTLALLQAAYTSPDAERIASLTVLGTFPFKSTKGKSVREAPVLRAVLSAERAAALPNQTPRWSEHRRHRPARGTARV